MCQADTHVITMKWGVEQSVPIGNFSSPHKCVNWDSLNNWAKSRHFDPFQKDYLVHPEFGNPYTDMDSVRLGEVHDH
jgi:hypothetical protein